MPQIDPEALRQVVEAFDQYQQDLSAQLTRKFTRRTRGTRPIARAPSTLSSTYRVSGIHSTAGGGADHAGESWTGTVRGIPRDLRAAWPCWCPARPVLARLRRGHRHSQEDTVGSAHRRGAECRCRVCPCPTLQSALRR